MILSFEFFAIIYDLAMADNAWKEWIDYLDSGSNKPFVLSSDTAQMLLR